MAFWLDIAAFALKALLIVAALGGLAILVARLARSGEPKDREIKVRSLNERYDDMRDAMNAELLDKKQRKAFAKARKKEMKARRGEPPGKRIYVMAFKGDMRATAVKQLGHEIDAVLTVARPETDEAVIRIESGGGTVTGYGLAAAEILRLRERKIKVTASVDQVAASGGYMMASAADRIVAAPFAVVGSIGVVAPVAQPAPAAEEERDRLRGDDRGRVQAHGLGARRDHAGRGASISAASSTPPTRRSRPMSRSAVRPSTSTGSPTATIGSRARRWPWASSTRSRQATNFCSAPATARGSTRSRRKRARICSSSCSAGSGLRRGQRLTAR